MKPKDRLKLLRSLPRELVGHIISFARLFLKLNVFTALELPQWKTQESYVRLWTTIFKSEDWLLHIIQQYNVKSVYIGFKMPAVGQKESDGSKEICLMPKIQGQPIWFKKEEMQLFLNCLRRYSSRVFRRDLDSDFKESHYICLRPQEIPNLSLTCFQRHGSEKASFSTYMMDLFQIVLVVKSAPSRQAFLGKCNTPLEWRSRLEPWLGKSMYVHSKTGNRRANQTPAI